MRKEEEIWRPIEGFEGYYEVSSWGRVRGLDRLNSRGYRIKGRIMRPAKNSDGYYCLILHKDGEPSSARVHILVATAFQDICGPRFDGCEVDHIDTDRQNNYVYNLRNCSRRENINNALTQKHLKNEIVKYWEKPEHREEASLRAKNTWSDPETRKRQMSGRNKIKKPVIQLSLEGEFIKEWDSASDVQRALGFVTSSISNCCTGKKEMAYGFIWRFKENVA